MRREVPDGDLAVIFDQAVGLMLEKVERAKLGAPIADRPRPDGGADHAYEKRIRFRTDGHSRHIPNAVKRTVWTRDGGRCAFVSQAGQRCGEGSFIEFHHLQP